MIYEQILKGIPKAKEEQARRLSQCLTVAVQPLRVEELTELLAFDFGASAGGEIPKLKADWRLGDQEEVILSICSSLITVVQNYKSPVVQFSHFSVKEYLTSPHLAHPNRNISHFRIQLESPHTTLTQACRGAVLRLDQGGGNGLAEEFPLVKYAARHWMAHARFDTVSSGIQKGWKIYSTHPSYILRRGSGHTTLTKTGTTPRFGCHPLLAVNLPFTMPHFMDSMTWRNV